jgi:hypothetical protein
MYSMYTASAEMYDCVKGIPCFDDNIMDYHAMFVIIGSVLLLFIIALILLASHIIEKLFMTVITVIFNIIYPICETIYKLLSIEITKCERKDTSEEDMDKD